MLISWGKGEERVGDGDGGFGKREREMGGKGRRGGRTKEGRE